MQVSADKASRVKVWTITTGAWILAGFLLITAALIFSAREDGRANPSVTNVGTSGYAAFAELLRRDGYSVSHDRSSRPDLVAGALVIAPRFGSSRFLFAQEGGLSASEEETVADPWDELKPYQRSVLDHVKDGGSAIEIVNRSFFDRASKLSTIPRTMRSAADPRVTFKINVPFGSMAESDIPYDEAAYATWFLGDGPFVTHAVIEGGSLVTVAEGLPLTNRFLDQEQNAEFGLDLVRRLAPPGSEIVFVEAGIGNSANPNVASTLGSWAVVARWQAVLLFAVLLYTLGHRFGLPEVDRRRERGSRELFDAIADVFRRSRNTGLALDNLLADCDHRIRAVLHAPTSLKRSELLQRVPQELREQYLNVSEQAVGNVGPRVATAAAEHLLALLEKFERDSRQSRGLKR